GVELVALRLRRLGRGHRGRRGGLPARAAARQAELLQGALHAADAHLVAELGEVASDRLGAPRGVAQRRGDDEPHDVVRAAPRAVRARRAGGEAVNALLAVAAELLVVR